MWNQPTLSKMFLPFKLLGHYLDVEATQFPETRLLKNIDYRNQGIFMYLKKNHSQIPYYGSGTRRTMARKSQGSPRPLKSCVTRTIDVSRETLSLPCSLGSPALVSDPISFLTSMCLIFLVCEMPLVSVSEGCCIK